MLKLSPIILAILMAVGMYLFSGWRTNRMLDRQSTELAEPRLAALTARLSKALDRDRIRVFVYEVSPVNGLASPDGRIFITRGFLDKYRLGEVSAEELASVIAHEIGHVALGHSKRRMFDFAGQNAIRVVLSMVLGRFLPGIGVYIASFLAGLLTNRLSRQDEYEADAFATALLNKAGIGAAPQISLLQKLEKMGAAMPGQFAWLMSHPPTKDRVAAIEANDRLPPGRS